MNSILRGSSLVAALAGSLLFPGPGQAESRPPLDQLVKRCVLILKCKVEIKDELLNYRVVESWKGKYRPDLFYDEPPEGCLYQVGREARASALAHLKDGQEVILFFTDNAVSAVKKGKILAHAHDDLLVIAKGKVVYALNSRFETLGGREVYTLEEFKKAILVVVNSEAKQKAKSKTDVPKALKDVPKELEAVPVPAKSPFDGDERKRAEYLYTYRRGYAWAQGTHLFCPTNPDAHNLHAIRGWIEGWQAGVKAGGQGDLPAKYAPYLIWRDPSPDSPEKRP
jgi:hypothetical protein